MDGSNRFNKVPISLRAALIGTIRQLVVCLLRDGVQSAECVRREVVP
jgi:hypothetical protein